MNIIDRWDEASKPTVSGLHNGGGFAAQNWREIRAEVERIRIALAEHPIDETAARLNPSPPSHN